MTIFSGAKAISLDFGFFEGYALVKNLLVPVREEANQRPNPVLYLVQRNVGDRITRHQHHGREYGSHLSNIKAMESGKVVGDGPRIL